MGKKKSSLTSSAATSEAEESLTVKKIDHFLEIPDDLKWVRKEYIDGTIDISRALWRRVTQAPPLREFFVNNQNILEKAGCDLDVTKINRFSSTVMLIGYALYTKVPNVLSFLSAVIFRSMTWDPSA